MNVTHEKCLALALKILATPTNSISSSMGTTISCSSNIFFELKYINKIG